MNLLLIMIPAIAVIATAATATVVLLLTAYQKEKPEIFNEIKPAHAKFFGVPKKFSPTKNGQEIRP